MAEEEKIVENEVVPEIDEPENKGGEEVKDDKKKEIVFDELPDEIKRFIDQQRTQASKTARDNALKDPSLRDAIKHQLEEEAKMTAEEKLARERAELTREKNILKAREHLMREGGIYGEDLDEALDFVVTDDEATTIARADKFIHRFKSLVDSALETKVQDMMKQTPKPRTSTQSSKKFDELSNDERVELKKRDPARYESEMSKRRVRI